MKRTNKKGFTIVELVVVIAVIAILAAIMIPTFSGVAGEAEDAANLADARAIYTEFLAAHPEAEIDYVESNGKYYNVKDFDDDPETSKPATGVVLEADTWMNDICEDVVKVEDETDGKCDKCGAEKPAQGGNG